MKYESDFDPVPPVKHPVSIGMMLMKGKFNGCKAMIEIQKRLKAKKPSKPKYGW